MISRKKAPHCNNATQGVNSGVKYVVLAGVVCLCLAEEKSWNNSDIIIKLKWEKG